MICAKRIASGLNRFCSGHFPVVLSNDVIVTSKVIFLNIFIFWKFLSSTIIVKNFIWLALMVPEIMGG